MKSIINKRVISIIMTLMLIVSYMDIIVVNATEILEVSNNEYAPKGLKEGIWSSIDEEELPEKPEANPGNPEVEKPAIEEENFNKEPIVDEIELNKIASFATGSSSKDGGAAEIVKYNKDNNKFYVIDGIASKIHVVSMKHIESGKDTQLIAEKTIDLKELVENDEFKYGDLTSISISTERKEIAVALQAENYSDNGKIAILDYEGNLKEVFNAGVQPDMVIFTPSSKYVLSANEGEPRLGYGEGIIDPEGSVTIVNLETKEMKNIGFENAPLDSNVILRKGDKVNSNSPKYDLEPEYITVDEKSEKAYVSLQENNAIATIDIESGNIDAVRGLGFKDHSIDYNWLDVVDNGLIQIENLPIKGVYMPDAITYYNGYIISANEGDATEFGSYENIGKLSSIKGNLDLKADNFAGYETQEELDIIVNKIKNETKYDKLEVLTEMGNDAIYTLGGRSFSIWNAETGNLVFDSGNDFETITAQRYPDYFNVSNNKIDKDARSTKKGPEAEEVKVGLVNGKMYAFIALERTGGIMTYDITNPAESKFVNYINTRDFSENIAGDVAPEGLDFISAENSPTNYPLIIAANEVSGTVSVIEIKDGFKREVKIVHTNDVHSRVDNYAKMKAYINKSPNNTLLVDAGDTLHGQSIATLENGSSIAKILKAMGYSAMVPGNHDFNYGQDVLRELGLEANVDILASNVTKDGKLAYGSYSIKEINGVKVGMFGIATPETSYKTNPKNVEGLEFGNLESIIETSNEMVKTLENEGADIIVALTHLGVDKSSEIKSTDVGSAVEGIDIIIDGHSHSNKSAYEEFNNTHSTKITSANEYLNVFGEITISLDENNNILDIELGTVDTKTLTEEDKDVSKLIEDIKESQAPILNVIVGKTPIKLDGSRESVRSSHTNLGRLITSAMINETGADIAITNGGGIRDSINAGDITKGDIIKVLPFGNYIVTKNVKGADIIAALNHGLVIGAGSFTHFAGLNVEVEKYINENNSEAYKVVKATTADGVELDENKEYTIATNDFMAVGGDGYEMFSPYETLNEYSALDEALINYMDKITPEKIMEIDKEVRLKMYVKEDNTEKPNGGSKPEDIENPENNNKDEIEKPSNNVKPGDKFLPETGGVNTKVILLVAILFITSGIILNKTSKKSKNIG